MRQAFFASVAQGHCEEVVTLLAQESTLIYSINRTQETALHIAVLQDNGAMIRLLLSHGANPAAVDCLGRTPLMTAVMAAKTDSVSVLAEQAPSTVNCRDGQGNTPLIQAVDGGHEVICKILLDQGAQVDADDNGQTALHLAAERGHVGIGKMLLAYGANINAYTRLTGQTPYHIACENNREAFINLLKESGADVQLLVHKPSPAQLQQELNKLLQRSQAIANQQRQLTSSAAFWRQLPSTKVLARPAISGTAPAYPVPDEKPKPSFP